VCFKPIKRWPATASAARLHVSKKAPSAVRIVARVSLARSLTLFSGSRDIVVGGPLRFSAMTECDKLVDDRSSHRGLGRDFPSSTSMASCLRHLVCAMQRTSSPIGYKAELPGRLPRCLYKHSTPITERHRLNSVFNQFFPNWFLSRGRIVASPRSGFRKPCPKKKIRCNLL